MEPHGVVFPRSEADIQEALYFARQEGIALLPRGGGSSLAGQAVGEALVLDLSRHFDAIGEIDPAKNTCRIRPGVVLSRLKARLAPQNLTFGPDPASESRATIGGMIANNATGTRSIVYRMTVDHLLAARVLLSDGTIHEIDRASQPAPGTPWARILEIARANETLLRDRYPKIWRRVSGYDLLRVLEAGHPLPILAGSEGTLGILLEAKLSLVRPPARTGLGVLAFDSLAEATAAVPEILETDPSAVELLDRALIRLAREAPAYRSLADFIEGDPSGILIVEYSGETEEVVAGGLKRLAEAAPGPIHEIRDAAGQKRVWELRRAGLDLLLSTRGRRKPLAFVEDCAVPVAHLPEFITRFDEIVARNGTTAAHYGHASAGVLHCRPLIDIHDPADVEKMTKISREVMSLVKSLGGSPSGEHGDGISLSSYLEDFFGPEVVGLFRDVKGLLDPGGLMNPGKIVDPVPFTDALRSKDARAVEIPTRLDWSADGGILAGLRMCNGAGTCRKFEGVMCPSFPATRDERHVTRGRANLLVAILEGRFAAGEAADHLAGETGEAIEEALSLCLSCKACRRECPSRVDIAKAKAEFLYARRAFRGPVRRILDYAFSRPEVLLSLRSLAALGRTRLHESDISRALAVSGPLGGPRILLFADTFTRTNDAAPFLAAARVLRRNGADVAVAAKGCCGRPAFSRGDLDFAAAKGRELLESLAPALAEGRRVVVLEPSCLSMMREDLPDLLGENARPLARAAVSLPEVLEEILPKGAPASRGTVLHHAHCHEKEMGQAEEWTRLLRRAGYDARLLDSGCCGMAGAFGYEHPRVSRAIAEDRFLPGLAEAARGGASITATGTSCRDQAVRFAGLAPVHPALLLE